MLSPKSLRWMLQATESITANIFHLINDLLVEAVESGRDQISDEAIENWRSELDIEAAFGRRRKLSAVATCRSFCRRLLMSCCHPLAAIFSNGWRRWLCRCAALSLLAGRPEATRWGKFAR